MLTASTLHVNSNASRIRTGIRLSHRNLRVRTILLESACPAIAEPERSPTVNRVLLPVLEGVGKAFAEGASKPANRRAAICCLPQPLSASPSPTREANPATNHEFLSHRSLSHHLTSASYRAFPVSVASPLHPPPSLSPTKSSFNRCPPRSCL